MNWIDKLERRYGNLGIPNLINGLLIGQLDRFGALSRFCLCPSGWAASLAC